MARPRQPFFAKIGVFAAATLSVVAGLECTPLMQASTKRPDPVITAEPRVKFFPSPRAKKAWNWPSPGQFHATITDVRRDFQPIRLVRGNIVDNRGGELHEFKDVVYSIAKEHGADTYRLVLEMAPGQDLPYQMQLMRGYSLDTAPLSAAKVGVALGFSRGRTNIGFEPTYISPPTASVEAVDAWAYVASLLAADPPVYDERPVHDEVDDYKREEEIASAKAAKDWTKAMSLYRSWRPVGRCSMDNRPAEVAREYADLCYDQGKLGCFLQLQVRIMNNGFERVAYSSYGDAAANTQSERLLDTGLDAEEFFLGLAVQFGNVRRVEEINRWRLARSIEESGAAPAVVRRLVAWAHDPEFDAYNRFRLVQLVAYLNADAQLDESRLSVIDRMWLEEERKEREAAKAN